MYTIQNNVPIPADILGIGHRTGKPSSTRVYPLHEMKIGDCFKFPSSKAVTVRGSIGGYNKGLKKQNLKTKTFRIRKLSNREHGCFMVGYNGDINTTLLLKREGRTKNGK